MIPVARIREALRYANTTSVAEVLNMLPPSGVVLSAEEVAVIQVALNASYDAELEVEEALALLDGADEAEK